ncbi:thioesterase family protein [Okibacterium endophyticum]
MHMMFRTILTFWLARRRMRRGRALGHYDVGRIRLTTLPTDLDLMMHMNNGVYLSIFDLGRFDLLIRSGLWDIFTERGWYPVVRNETISFRKSLKLWQRFTVESRVIGFDDRSVFIEQRIVVKGEIYTKAHIRGRFLKKSGGSVSIDELIDAVGGMPENARIEEWMVRWSADVSLPSTKDPAPSAWD